MVLRNSARVKQKCVTLNLLIEREQVEQIEANHCEFLFRNGDYALKFVVVTAEDANVALELSDVLLLH